MHVCEDGGIVQAKILIQTFLCHLHVGPNQYDFLSSVEHKSSSLAEYVSCSFQYNEGGCSQKHHKYNQYDLCTTIQVKI